MAVGNIKVDVNVAGIEPFKQLATLAVELASDNRIPEELRNEIKEKLQKIGVAENMHEDFERDMETASKRIEEQREKMKNKKFNLI